MPPSFFYKYFLCLFSFITLFKSPVFAQYNENDFIHYTVKDGLSENFVTCLQQDDWGYIWIGTDIGLNRFDGNSFKKFYQGSAPLPLPSNAIRKLKLFGPHQLGIISPGGFQLFNTKNFTLQNYFIPDTTAFSVYLNAAWDAVQVEDKGFLLSTGTGVYAFDKSGNIRFRHDAYVPADAGNRTIRYGREIFSISPNEYLVYLDDKKMGYYHADSNSFHKIRMLEKNRLSVFLSPKPNIDYWISKRQVSKNEFIFLYYQQDSIVYYNHALNKKVVSPLSFEHTTVFSWESKIEMLNDSVFAINDRINGFYLFDLDRQTGKITCHPKKLLPSYKINCLFTDKDKRLWIGTTEGVLQQKLNVPLLKSFSFTSHTQDSITGGFYYAYRYKDKIYLGRFSRNYGLLILNASTMQPVKQISFYGKNNSWNEIRSVQMYHPDTLWLGTSGGILWFDTKTDRYGKVMDLNKNPGLSGLSAVLAPPHGDGFAWICNFLGGVVARYHIASRTFTFFTSETQPALPFAEVKNIAYDSYGDVWISGHGLARWNNRKQIFDTLITVYGGLNKFNDDILTMSADANGSLWLHNALNGLLEYRIKEKKFIAYTMEDGLPSVELRCFSPVIDNILWIGSNNNLTKFDTRTKKMTVYNRQDGLPEQRPSSRGIYFDKPGRLLYLLCNNELGRFPVQPPENPHRSSALMVEELVAGNKKIFFNPGKGIRLKPNENNLSLHFTVIDFEAGNDYQFAYKLNNADTWTGAGGQRNINLTGLPSGRYSVQLRAMGKSGEEKLNYFTFYIAPPFRKTGWFFAGCGILLAGLIYSLYRYRIKQIRQKADIDKLLSQTEMKALHAQMNPHFIFNSLNSIREMILNNENKEASHFLSKFAQLIRVTLDQSGQSFISLRNTIDYLHRYIEMEQIRNSHFTSRILSDEELDPDETVLPPMLIQPFIENAIWHGTTGTKKNININVDFKKENNQLVCIIEDNGIGIDQSLQYKKNDGNLHNPVGIANIKNRIRLLNEKYNLKCSITIEDKTKLAGYTETGTLVTLQLPLETADNE